MAEKWRALPGWLTVSWEVGLRMEEQAGINEPDVFSADALSSVVELQSPGFYVLDHFRFE